MPFYYQARNNWGNNIPNWRFHGGENVVLGGKYEGLFLGVATLIQPDRTYYCEAFPFMVPKADGLSVAALRPIRIVVHSYDPGKEIVAIGKLEALSTSPRSTGVQIKAERFIPGKNYQLLIDNYHTAEKLADKYGIVMFILPLQQDGQKSFQLILK